MPKEVKEKKEKRAKAGKGKADEKVGTQAAMKAAVPQTAVADEKATAQVAPDGTGAQPEAAAKISRKKLRRAVPQGRAYIHASYNNTKVTLTDETGNVIAWASSGLCGFKGTKKSTP